MKTFLIEIPIVRREFIVTERTARVGELISSRHPGLFDAEAVEAEPGESCYTLQRAMWLLDKPARWFADRVREGELRAYRHCAALLFPEGMIRRLVDEGLCELPADDWCCRVEDIRVIETTDADGVVVAGPLPIAAADDRQQLRLHL